MGSSCRRWLAEAGADGPLVAYGARDDGVEAGVVGGLDEVRQLVGDHVVKALGRVGGKPRVDADRAAGGRARAHAPPRAAPCAR